jgi:hypothetical protein
VKRRRISLGEAVKAATGAAVNAPSSGTDSSADLLAFPLAFGVGLWWWIRGAPVVDEPTNSSEDVP